jgi:eukaryotic-like serine/threonine-protein kinase
MREFQDGELVPGTRYRVRQHLGSGGMGSVYLVEHTELGKEFVLKALFRELSTRKDLVARLRQEWRALARLNHANIVNVTDAGTTDTGIPYYVMEHVAGETLSDLLKREHALGIPRAVGITADVLDGLHAAHEIGIVHRDVKPPNIFVLGGGAGVKLLDFGIAKLADSASVEVITARGVAIGTPRYMSPEAARGKAVDARADLYAAGLVLFEAVAGAGPFDAARDANELLIHQITKPAPRLSEFHRAVTPELDDIVASLLAKDPAQRPTSAKLVAAALRALLVRRPPSPSTHGTTPKAGYEAVTAGQVTEVPSTRPDGVAGRAAEREGTTISAPIPSVAVGAAVSGVPPSELVTTSAMPAPDAPERTSAGLEWAKDGFDTALAPAPVGLTQTQVSAPPSSLLAPVSRGVTLRLEDARLFVPPHEIATRTAVPAVESGAPVEPLLGAALSAPMGETPPPMMTTSPSLVPPSRGLGPVVAIAVAASLILVLGLGFVALRWARPSASSSPEPAATALPAPPPAESAAALPPAPSEAPPVEPGPAASSPEPAMPAPAAPPRRAGAAADRQTPEKIAKTAEKPAAPPAPPPAPPAKEPPAKPAVPRGLPASGL